MRKFIDIMSEALDDALSSYTPVGDLKSEDELNAMAIVAMNELSHQEYAALLRAKEINAIDVKTDWLVKGALTRKGISTGFSRSGDNADTLTPMGELLVSKL